MQKRFRGLGSWFGLMLLFMIISFIFRAPFESNSVSYSQFVKDINAGNVSRMILDEYEVTFFNKDEPTKPVKVNIPSHDALYSDCGAQIAKQMNEGTLIQEASGKGIPFVSIFNIITSVIIILLFVSMFLSTRGGKNNGFTRTPARIESPEGKDKVKFSDVAGALEEKAELEELVDFLKNPDKFIALGARIPKGILLVGPPGTGKTLLARAVAGEAGVPFFSISGSDFVELYVGVGASRVRDLFNQAKKNKPCIIFIDEIDAVGRKRGAGMGGGHDEREQTLNQLLVEMDGFGKNEGVIMIAATNRPDILDPALLRPGRFDRQVVVSLPDVRGREEILKVHTRNKPLSDEVNLETLAKTTAGYSGADLENVMNEAAIFAARREHAEIKQQDLEDANIKVMMGSEKRSRVISDGEKRLTAFHEAGHAVLAHIVDKSSVVNQVSIIPRGRAGGYTMYFPKEDSMYMTRNEMLNRIVVLLGGRVAEELTSDDITTGASNDLERATEIARDMVVKYGMSKNIGPVSYHSEDEVFLGRDFAHSQKYSEETASSIDAEVKAIMTERYNEAKKLLAEHRDKLTSLAELLIKEETINGEQFTACMNG